MAERDKLKNKQGGHDMQNYFAGIGIGIGIGAGVIFFIAVVSGGEMTVTLLGLSHNIISYCIIGLMSMWKIPYFKSNALKGMILSLLLFLPGIVGTVMSFALYASGGLENAILANLIALAIHMAAGALIGFLCGKAWKRTM